MKTEIDKALKRMKSLGEGLGDIRLARVYNQMAIYHQRMANKCEKAAFECSKRADKRMGLKTK